MCYGHYFLSRTGVDYGLGLNSPFHPRFGKRFLQVFYVFPTWDLIFHKCFMLSQLGISFYTSVFRFPNLGFHFTQVFSAIRLSDFIFHEYFMPSDSQMLLTTTCTRRNFNSETPPKDWDLTEVNKISDFISNFLYLISWSFRLYLLVHHLILILW